MRPSRAVVALVGAGAALLVGGLGPEATWGMIDGPVLVLLFGLMLVNGALAEAGLFRWVAAAVARRPWRPAVLLVALTFVAGILSALFLNDTVVLMLTPLVVRTARGLGGRPLPFLLSLALAANVGSVATVTGNPQNVLVAMSAGIGCGSFLAARAVPALLGLVVVATVVGVVFRSDLRARLVAPGPQPWPAHKPHSLRVATIAVVVVLVAFSLGAPVPTVTLVVGAVGGSEGRCTDPGDNGDPSRQPDAGGLDREIDRSGGRAPRRRRDRLLGLRACGCAAGANDAW